MRSAIPSTILRQAAPRTAFRRSAGPARRHASTEATQKKAQDTLASAQENAGKLLDSAKKFLEPVGQTLGRLLGSYRQPITYNLAVTREVLKQIYVRESLQPPNLTTIQTTYKALWSRAINPAYWKETVRTGDILKVGIYGVEAYGIFKIGEILGRRNLVGYDLH